MPTPPLPEPAAAAPPLCVRQVAALPPAPPGQPAWLIDSLWGYQAVGVLGGPPKTCKTFLALEMALAVAAGTPCLGRFAVPHPGPVLLFAAEDDPLHIRARLAGLAHVRQVDFQRLPVFLILAAQLRLDQPADQRRLAAALETYRPRLLLLDPLVRLHRVDENAAQEVAPLLADLRALQRRFGLAVLLVHHTRKAHGPLSGQDLRGSGDLHAWGDSNLYLRPAHEQLCLTVEHRAAPAPAPMTLALSGDPPHLQVEATPRPTAPGNLAGQVLEILRQHPTPLSQEQLRAQLQVRNQSLTAALHQLRSEQRIRRAAHGWMALG
jgi:hypothetical protein